MANEYGLLVCKLFAVHVEKSSINAKTVREKKLNKSK